MHDKNDADYSTNNIYWASKATVSRT